ncbi:hypothetical protein [Beijerinckia indica]|uniref:hypothetical protein n=1 Tax=Beijerinckia indica TaxID=533 RepID=UPI0002FAD53B|nr:hypothetical protein [Beijerinckia indica]
MIGEQEATVRIPALKAEILQIELELASLEEEPKIIALHPAAIEKYLETVDRLAIVLADHAQAKDDRGNLIKDLRSLIHSVIIHPNLPGEGFKVEVKGKLAALISGLSGQVFPQALRSGCKVVAEEGLEPPTQGL